MNVRPFLLLGVCSLCLLGGCPPSAPGSADPNSSSTVTGAAPADNSGGDSSSTLPTTGNTGGGTGGSSGSGSGAQNFSGCQFDLQGFWREDGGAETRYVAIDHVGPTVVSTFLQPAVCNHRDGNGTTSTTEDDFVGTVTDCQIVGTIQLCQYGCTDQCTNGWVDSQNFSAAVSSDGQSISGLWTGADGTEGSLTLTRMACQPRLSDEFGLQDTGGVRWTRSEVTVQTGSDPSVGLSILFSPANGAALTAPTPFNAGFDGAVASVSPSNGSALDDQVVVELRDGTEITYSFNGQILVNVGDNVQANTPVGTMAAGNDVGLNVDATDRHGSPVNVDCIDVGPFVNP